MHRAVAPPRLWVTSKYLGFNNSACQLMGMNPDKTYYLSFSMDNERQAVGFRVHTKPDEDRWRLPKDRHNSRFFRFQAKQIQAYLHLPVGHYPMVKNPKKWSLFPYLAWFTEPDTDYVWGAQRLVVRVGRANEKAMRLAQAENEREVAA